MPLAEHFLATDGCAGGVRKTLDSSAQAAPRVYYWPGNVRELQAVICALAVFVDPSVITSENIESELIGGKGTVNVGERCAVVLDAHDWNVTAAARALGWGRTKLYAVIRQYGLQRPAEVTR